MNPLSYGMYNQEQDPFKLVSGVVGQFNPTLGGLFGAIGDYREGNEEVAIQNLMNYAIQGLSSASSIFSTNWGGAPGSAEAEVEASEDEIKTVEREIVETHNRTQEKIADMIRAIDKKAAEVEAALKVLQEKSDEVDEQQKKLEEQKKIVDENVEILNNPDKSPEEKKTALGAIRTAGTAITNLANVVLAMTATIENQDKIVEAATQNIAEYQADAAKYIDKELKSMDEINRTTIKDENGKNIEYQQEGAQETENGTKLVMEGTTLQATPATAAAGTGMVAQGQLLIEAGQTHIQGGAANLTAIGNTLGTWGESYSTIASLTSTVGAAGTEAATTINSYMTKANLLRTSIGAWTPIQTAAEELLTKANEYEETINENFNLQFGQVNNFTPVMSTNPSGNDHSFRTNEKFEFDTKRLTLNNGELNIAGDTGDIFDIDNNLLELPGNMA